jgi:hypothetical protein
MLFKCALGKKSVHKARVALTKTVHTVYTLLFCAWQVARVEQHHMSGGNKSQSRGICVRAKQQHSHARHVCETMHCTGSLCRAAIKHNALAHMCSEQVA